MTSLVKIQSPSQFQALLSSTAVVVTDFYADWCGPCKAIAPRFEQLAQSLSRPGRVAFAKVDVDSQTTISSTYQVSAMPTFKIFHRGVCIQTIQGANPSALESAVFAAAKLAGSGPAGGAAGDVFKTPGRRLGGAEAEDPGRQPVLGPSAGASAKLSVFGLIKTVIAFFGLYLWSLFSLDPYKAAENSPFNVNAKSQPVKLSGTKTATGKGAGKGTGKGTGTSTGQATNRKTTQSNFRTLADLNKED